MFVKRSIVLAVFAAAAVVLMAGSASAWCSPYIDKTTTVVVAPNRGTAGLTGIVLTGQNWMENQQLEAHWDTVAGPLLGSTTIRRAQDQQTFYGTFRLDQVVIPPDATPGRHKVVAFVTGSVPSQMSAEFLVVSPGAGTGVAGTPDQAGSESAATSGGLTAVPPAPQVAPTTADGSTRSVFAVPPPTAPGDQATAPESIVTGNPALVGGGAGLAPGNPAVGVIPVVRANPSVVGGNPGVALPSPILVGTPGGSITSGPLRQPTIGDLGRPSAFAPASGSLPVADDQGRPVPSSRSALGNPWQGFGEGAKSAAHGLGDLTHRSSSLAPSVSPLVLPPLAMFALFGGFGVAELRRRRATATTAS